MAPNAPALARAIERHKAGDFAGAERLYRDALKAEPRNADAVQYLAVALFEQGRTAEGLAAVERAVALAPANPEVRFNHGLMLAGLKRHAEAAAAFRAALRLAPAHLGARYNLGAALLAMRDAPGAVAAFEAVLARAPTEIDSLTNLGIALAASGRFAEAADRLAHAVRLAPRHADAAYHLGAVRERLGDLSGALEAYDRALEAQPGHLDARVDRADVLRALGRGDEARAAFDAAIATAPQAPAPRLRLGDFLLERGEVAAARAVYAALLESHPADIAGLAGHAIAQFEPIHPDSDSIAVARRRYAGALDRLAAAVATLPGGPGEAAEAVGTVLPFYLGYQNGDDDAALQRRFGDVLCDALGPRAPALLARPRRGRLRIAMIAGHFRAHAVWKILTRGWVEALDRERFELCIYSLDPRRDEATAEAEAHADLFVSGLPDEAAWHRRLAEDAPDIALFPEVSMDPATTRLAATRLAPLQAAAWGHPITTGLRTIDLFLSSDLMEPPDGERHYVEPLVRLPNLSICYRPPRRDPPPLNRAALGLPLDRVVLLCCQSLFKYLPRHDRVLVEIARGVPDAVFAFIEALAPPFTAAFRARLGRAFADAGLAFEERVRFVRRLDPNEYDALAGLADVYLDSLEWSGGNTTLECVARDLPIVTHAGRFMRGRHTAGIMRMMGLGERVAATEDAYVAEAVRLGRDGAARAEARAEIAARKSLLYRDPEPVAALAEILAKPPRR